MITLKRSDLYRFAQVAGKMFGQRKPKHAFVCSDRSGTALVMATETAVLRMNVDPQPIPAPFPLPWELIQRLGKENDDPVGIERGNEVVNAKYSVKGMEKTVNFALQTIKETGELPGVPEKMKHISSEFIDRVWKCSPYIDPDSDRYSLGNVALNGTNGMMTATDGRQAISFEGNDFPWEETVLLKPNNVFALKEIHGSGIVGIGNHDSWLTIQSGIYTLQFKNSEGKYPKMEHVFDNSSRADGWIDLDERDCDFLSATLDSLPAINEVNMPVTIELADRVILRGADEKRENVTELVLAHSSYSGKELRVSMDRFFLQQALHLGHRRIGIASGTNTQFWATGIPDCRYVWMAVEGADVLKSEKMMTLSSADDVPSRIPSKPPQTKTNPLTKETPGIMNISKPIPVLSTAARVMKKEPTTRETDPPTLLQNAEKLEKSLREALTATQQIIRQSKAQVKRNHALRATLSSLKQLQNLDTAS